MKMIIQMPLVVVLCFLVAEVTSGKLLLILLDGFRWDYLDQDLNLPAFNDIFLRGARAKRLVPTFPSVSYPNHYTLLTGLYAESHGFVGNTIYDVATSKTYAPLNANQTPEENSFMYEEAEPLWITATKQGNNVYMFHWIGCDVVIQGKQPRFCRQYRGSPSLADFRLSLDESLELFRNSSADLAAVYYDAVDDLGHRFGPMTTEVNYAITQIDAELGRMVTKMTESGLDKEVDVMIFSDHGMAAISPSRVANISDVIQMPSIDRLINGYGPYVFIWPKTGKEQEVYDAVKTNPHYTAYLKKDIPAEWHFRNNHRIPPLILVSNIHWYIDTPNFGYYEYDTGPMLGEHGFAPGEKSMSGIFTSFGPSFVPGVTTEYLDNVNLYQIMCHVLDAKPRSHNGTWSRVSHMVSSHSSASIRHNMLFTLLSGCVFLTFCINM